MSVWELPTALNVNGKEYKIRTDFRAVLDILKYFADPDYENDEKWAICLEILYEDFSEIPRKDWEEAMQKALEFIEMNMKEDGKPKPTLMDWEQDAPIVIPAINKVLHTEIRSLPYLHWWSFMGAYMEVGESLYSYIVGIREKMARGKKLDKAEREFLNRNRHLVVLKKKYSKEELEEQERLKKILGG